METDGEKKVPEQNANGVEKTPDAPKPAATGELADKVASDIAKAPEVGQSTLPNNQFGRMAVDAQKWLKENPSADGALARGLLAVLVFLAENASYIDLMPGHFYDQLDVDSVTKDLVPAPKEAENLLAFKKDRPKPGLTDEEKTKLGADNSEGMSASYVAKWLLGGETKINDAASLSASLKHARRNVNGEAVPYFRGDENGKRIMLSELKRGMPAGTVLVFVPEGLKNPTKIVAVATGRDTEFEYMDSSGALKIANLSDSNQELIKSDLNLLAAFVPKFNTDEGYFANHPEQFDSRFDPQVT